MRITAYGLAPGSPVRHVEVAWHVFVTWVGWGLDVRPLRISRRERKKSVPGSCRAASAMVHTGTAAMKPRIRGAIERAIADADLIAKGEALDALLRMATIAEQIPDGVWVRTKNVPTPAPSRGASPQPPPRLPPACC